MDTKHSARRRAFLAALLAGGVCAAAQAHGIAPAPFVKSNLVQVDVYDRANGTALPVYAKDGRHYIVGVPGHEYAVRIRNCTGARILAVTSVDGVNVISGDTAVAGAIGLRAGAVGLGGDRRLAQELRAHRRVLLHRPRRLVRRAHRPPAERRRDRRRGVPGARAAHRRGATSSAASRRPNEAQPSADKAERRGRTRRPKAAPTRRRAPPRRRRCRRRAKAAPPTRARGRNSRNRRPRACSARSAPATAAARNRA